MLRAEENEKLTQVGPGTPMGELLRRYWYPVATCQEMYQRPTKAVRLLGENFTLYKDRKGRFGLIGQRCAHRNVDLRHGIPTEDGLMCPYHGWTFDATGQCIHQPAESPQSTFASRIKIAGHSAEELGGLVWAYIGPEPAPLLPRWEPMVKEHTFRHIGVSMLNANWVQCMENSVDPTHAEYCHGYYALHELELAGSEDPVLWRRAQAWIDRHHVGMDFEPFEHGIIKYRRVEGQPVSLDDEREGHPLVFPYMVHTGGSGVRKFEIRVPVDDTHTWHLMYEIYMPEPEVEVPVQDPVPAFEVPFSPLNPLGQDLVCWEAQQDITDRPSEHLAESDKGLIVYRKMLFDQAKIVEDGGDPINVFRDPAKNISVRLPMEKHADLRNYQPGMVRYVRVGEYSPVAGQLDDLLMKSAEVAKKRTAAGEKVVDRYTEWATGKSSRA